VTCPFGSRGKVVNRVHHGFYLITNFPSVLVSPSFHVLLFLASLHFLGECCLFCSVGCFISPPAALFRWVAFFVSCISCGCFFPPHSFFSHHVFFPFLILTHFGHYHFFDLSFSGLAVLFTPLSTRLLSLVVFPSFF